MLDSTQMAKHLRRRLRIDGVNAIVHTLRMGGDIYFQFAPAGKVHRLLTYEEAVAIYWLARANQLAFKWGNRIEELTREDIRERQTFCLYWGPDDTVAKRVRKAIAEAAG